MDPSENQRIQEEHSKQRAVEREQAHRRVQEGEEPWREETGVLSVVDAVRDVEFPKTADELVGHAGDRMVRTSEDVELPLAYVLPKLKEQRFPSLKDFQTAVQRHWEGIEQLELPPEERGRSQTMPPGADID